MPTKVEADIIDKLEVNALVASQDVGGGFDADDLESISMVFHEAAKALQDGKHGKIVCEVKGYGVLAEVGLAQPGREFDWDKGLPLLLKVPHAKTLKRRN